MYRSIPYDGVNPVGAHHRIQLFSHTVLEFDTYT